MYDKRATDSMDPKKFMIPVYYNLQDESKEYGNNASIYTGPTVESFHNQFEPQKINNNYVVSANDVNTKDKNASSIQNQFGLQGTWAIFENEKKDDMTYGIVAKDDKSFTHNNMNAFNRMRDFETPELRDSRKLEYFSGSSITYTPKKETEPFFKPVKEMTYGQGGMPGITSFIESRMMDGVHTEKRKQKPFEPRKIGPGIGLSVDQDSLGGIHDTIRILPKTIDDTRRQDNLKVSYTGPVIPGKKGDKRSVVAPFERRHSDTFRTNVETVKNGGQFKAQMASENINIELGNRTFSTPLMGPASGNYTSFNPKTHGQVQESTNIQLNNFNTGPANFSTKSSHNTQSFNVYATERMSTNTHSIGPVSRSNKSSSFNPNDVAKQTQILQSYEPGTMGTSNNKKSTMYNPNELAKQTQQLQSYDSGTMGTSNNQKPTMYNPNELAKSTQQLQSYESRSMGTSNNQKPTMYNRNELAKSTQQLQSYDSGTMGTSNNQKPIMYNPNELAKSTQQLQSYESRSMGTSNNQKPTMYNPNDTVKQTQQLQSYESRSMGTSNNQKPTMYNPNDTVKQTQQLQSYESRSMGTSNNQKPTMYNPNDTAKQTQILESFNTGTIGSSNNQRTNMYNPNDTARLTQQLQSFNTGTTGSSNNQNTTSYNPNDIAKLTQQLQSFNTGATGSSNNQNTTSYNPNEIARLTQQLQSLNTGATGSSNNQNITSYNPNEIARLTQQLQSLNTGIMGSSNNQNTTSYNPNDIAKLTQQLQSLNTGVAGYRQSSTAYDPNQLVNPTLRQTTDQPFNTFLGASNTLLIADLQDKIRETQKQNLITETNMGYMNMHTDQGYTVTDMHAPTTIKQLINYNNYNSAVGNQTTSMANAVDATNWDVALTLKDIVKNNNYIGTAGFDSQTIAPILYADTNTSKEFISQSRQPTNSNYNMIPDSNILGEYSLKEHVNIDRFNPPNQINFNQNRLELNQTNKTKVYYDDNINQNQNNILTNPYYNNGIAKINYISNNSNINQNNTFIVPETNSSRNHQ
jgi:hypothetical protein